jgi:hypothetical protein
MLESLLGFVLLVLLVGVILAGLSKLPIDGVVRNIIYAVVIIVLGVAAVLYIADFLGIDVPRLGR